MVQGRAKIGEKKQKEVATFRVEPPLFFEKTELENEKNFMINY